MAKDIIEPEIFIELWEIVRSYIPTKERSEVAELFMNSLDSYGYAEALDEYTENMPKDLKNAFNNLYSEDEDEDEDEGY